MQWIRNNILGLVAIFIALSGTAFAAGLAKNSVKSKQIKDGQVKGVDVAGNALTGANIDESSLSGLTAAPSGAAGGALTGTYPNPGLADGGVATALLGDGSVTTAKLADTAVDTAKLADNAVNAAKLANDAVDTGALQLNSVDTGAIESDGVRGTDFFANTTENFDPPSVAGNTCASMTRNTGALANVISTDQVVVTVPASVPAGVLVQAIAVSGGVVLDFCNVTASALDPVADSYDLLVISD